MSHYTMMASAFFASRRSLLETAAQPMAGGQTYHCVLDIANCSTASGIEAQQWEWVNSACQIWQAEPVDDGFVQLKPTHNETSCLEYSVTVDTLTQGSCGSQGSHWRIDPLAKGAYRIVSRLNEKVLDVASCGFANGTSIGVYDWLDNECQRFFLRSAQ